MKKAASSLEALRPSVVRALNGFTGQGEYPENWAIAPMSREDFPVPELLLLLLRDVMSLPWGSEAEKSRWIVYFWVDGNPFAVELAKFGLRLNHSSVGYVVLDRICGQLKQALRRLESRLEPLMDEQVKAGNITLENRSAEFEARYRFFRDKADVAFRAAKRKPRRPKSSPTADAPTSELTKILLAAFAQVPNRREGFYYSVAMIDAYFSYLEHRLVLLRAFQGAPLPNGGIKEILLARWDDKLTSVIGSLQTTHGQLIGRLRMLKENIRNPFAHGGTQNDGGSIYCHVPGVGAIPGNLSRTKHSANFKWIPVDTEDHQSACELFDETDGLLRTAHLKKPSLLATGGVHPVWTEDELSVYRKLGKRSLKEVEAYVTQWNDVQDRHENMDY